MQYVETCASAVSKQAVTASPACKLCLGVQLDTQLQKAQSQAELNSKEQLTLQQKIQESTAGKENSVCCSGSVA